jgi:MoaA/NifB/PqqE/SkfB family radical SAM enzyme
MFGLLPRKIRPTSAVLRLTHNCQARCVTCDYWKETTKDNITTEDAIRLIQHFADMGVRDLYLLGGEPLIRTDLFEILDRADAERFTAISIQTNGLLLKRLHQQINDSPITHVSISIDALGEKNDLIRGVKGYFDLAIEGAKLLRGKDIVLCTTLTGPGADDLEGLVEIAESYGWRFSYNLLDNRHYYFQGADVESVWPKPFETEKILSVLRDRLNRPYYELEYAKRYLLAGAPQDGPVEPPCFRGFNIVTVTSEGDVLSGCNVLPSMGNIFQEDIVQIVGSDAYRERALSMLRRECIGCTCSAMENVKAANRFQWLAKLKNGILSWGRQKDVATVRILLPK